jgi:ATP-dependent protease ClpP protease subunit
LEEKQLEERLKGLRLDTENIAGVIAANCGKSEEEVHQAMLDRTTLNAEQAMEWGLVHEIRERLIELSGPLISIQ